MSFKDKVIQVVHQIPRGRVTTYGTVSLLAGIPRGAKIVGGILHCNADKYQLPWHRVINRKGYISTNCPEHMKALQRALLQDEGIDVADDFIVNLEKYGWWGE